MKLKNMILAAGLATAAFVTPAFADEIQVTDPAGLAAAVDKASAGDVLVLSANTTYTLTDQLVITNAITIRGAGIDSSIIKQTTKEKRVIVIDYTDARVEGCTITGASVSTEINNITDKYGIAVTITGNGGTLYNCRVTGNRDIGHHNKNNCVGVYVRTPVTGMTSLVSHCRIDDNTISGGTTETYGGLRMQGGTAEYCLVEKNVGHQCGGIGVSGACTVKNCIFYANEAIATKVGSNVYIDQMGGVFTDCIFFGGISPGRYAGDGRPEWDAGNCGVVQGCATFNNCSFPSGVTLSPNWAGTAFNSDPAFVDLVDFQSRLSNPKTAGIGWKPVDLTKPCCDFAVSSLKPVQGATVTLTAHVNLIDSPNYVWTITDPDEGVVTVSGATPSFEAAKTGNYTVSLTVSGFAAPVTEKIAVGAAKVYPTTGTELVDAVNAACDGQEIVLEAKTYEITKPLVLTTAAKIVGQGRDLTTIKQTSKSTRVLYLNCAGAVVEGVTLYGGTMNDEGVHGCCVKIESFGGMITNCTITGTKCPKNWTFGIGVAQYGGVVSHCIISNNTVDSTQACNGTYGGGIYIQLGKVSNCLISGNSSQSGAGVYVDGTDAHVENCTIVKNIANAKSTPTVGGLYVAKAANFVNDIIALNDSASTAATDTLRNFGSNFANANCTTCLFGSKVSSTYIKGTPIFADPLFEDADNGDFREKGSSPSVNAGTDYEGMAGKDLAGFTRKSGSAVDIGCYEFDSSAMTVSFKQSATAGFAGASVTFTATVSGMAEGATPVCTWTVTGPDGEPQEQTEKGLVLTIAPTAYGYYTVAVVATAGSATTPECSMPDCYAVCPSKMYVKEATEESMAAAKFPYATPETAATNVFDAFNVAMEGAEIALLAGEHRIDQTLELKTPLTISGAGWTNTTLRQTAKTKQVVYINNAAAVVRGITITGVRAEGEIDSSAIKSGAVTIDSLGGTVEDCRITDNQYKWGKDENAGINQSRGVGITLNGASAVCRRCIIDRNLGSNGVNNDRGGGVSGLAGLLENCLVCLNTNKNAGGIFVGGPFTIRNCTVYGNCGWSVDSNYGKYGVGGLCVGGMKDGTSALSKGDVLVENTIFAANESPAQRWSDGGDPEIRIAEGKVTFENCLSTSETWPELAVAVTKCLNGDPRFANPSSGDWHLTLDSPARNSGNTRTAPAGATDLDGENRIFGRWIDMGCYELQKGYGTQLLLR